LKSECILKKLYIGRQQRAHFHRHQNKSCLGDLVPVGGGKWWGKGVYYVNMYVNGKIRTVETIPGMEEGRIK
jgi:hypothetical protein